jgi:hypothetical protein
MNPVRIPYLYLDYAVALHRPHRRVEVDGAAVRTAGKRQDGVSGSDPRGLGFLFNSDDLVPWYGNSKGISCVKRGVQQQLGAIDCFPNPICEG